MLAEGGEAEREAVSLQPDAFDGPLECRRLAKGEGQDGLVGHGSLDGPGGALHRRVTTGRELLELDQQQVHVIAG